MKPEDTVDRKPEIVSPATPISTPTSTFNPKSTIIDLILKLKSCFQLEHFEEVAAILQSREDKLKRTISDLQNREDELNMKNIELRNQFQTLGKKCTNLETSSEKFALEKERIEAELKKCKADCEVYRDDQILIKYELEKIRLDFKMWREKEDIVVERYEKRIAELEKKDENERLHVENVKLKEEVVKLKGENVGLVDGKKKAEELARYWENKYKQFEPKVKKLEDDYLMMLGNDPVLEKSVEKKVSLLRNPFAINLKSVNNGNEELVKRQKQSNLSKYDANAHASPCAGFTAESPLVDTDDPAEAGIAAGSNSSVMAMACGKSMPTENQVVIEIDDSDDETPVIETASASKTYKDYGRSCDMKPASQSISRGKCPLVCRQSNGDVGDACGSNNNKKRKMDLAFSNQADGNSYLSDENITTLAREKLVSKIWANKPFNFKVEMLTAFNKDDDLCLNAVCALHRVQKSDKLPCASQYRGFTAIDATRGYHLAKFLINGNPQGKIQKSVIELQEYDSKGIEECRKLARNHLEQLFQIYQEEEDPLFKEYLVKNYSKKAIS